MDLRTRISLGASAQDVGVADGATTLGILVLLEGWELAIGEIAVCTEILPQHTTVELVMILGQETT